MPETGELRRAISASVRDGKTAGAEAVASSRCEQSW
jgi:hypothetical protein